MNKVKFNIALQANRQSAIERDVPLHLIPDDLDGDNRTGKPTKYLVFTPRSVGDIQLLVDLGLASPHLESSIILSVFSNTFDYFGNLEPNQVELLEYALAVFSKNLLLNLTVWE